MGNRSVRTSRGSRAQQRNRPTGRSVGSDTCDETRIGELIEPQPNGCWLYDGEPDAYGRQTVAGQRVVAHRYVYEVLVGPIPDGHHLHHRCETKGCCNPTHLDVLTPSDHAQLHADLRRACR